MCLTFVHSSIESFKAGTANFSLLLLAQSSTQVTVLSRIPGEHIKVMQWTSNGPKYMAAYQCAHIPL